MCHLTLCVQLEGQLYKGVVPGYEAWGTALCAGTNFIVQADALQACPATHTSHQCCCSCTLRTALCIQHM